MALLDNAFYISGNTTVGGPIDLGTNNNSTGATLTLAIASGLIPAASLVVVLINEAVTLSAGTLSDGTNSYHLDNSEVVATSVGIGMIFSFYYTTAPGAITLTYTKGGTGDKAAMSAMCATGVASSGALDSAVTAVAQSSSATPTLTSGVPSVTGEWIVAAIAWDAGSALTYTQATSGGPFAAPFDTVTTQNAASIAGGNINVNGTLAVTYAPTLSGAPTGAALMIVGYKPAGSQSGWWGVTPWAASTAETCGALVRQNLTPAVGNERVFVCYNSTSGTGTTGASEPTWVITRGGHVTDNGVKWAEATGIAALNGDLSNTPTWTQLRTATATAALGQVIQNGAGTLLLLCTVGGTMSSLGSEPSWSAYTTTGATTTDNGATWVTLGAQNKYSIWNSPHARANNAYTSTWGQNSNSFFVSSIHAETQPSTSSPTVPGSNTVAPTNTYCVANSPGSVPPGTNDITTGATISTTGGNTLTISGTNYTVNGIIFNAGSGSSGGYLVVVGGGVPCKFDNCGFRLTNTAASSVIEVANNLVTFNSNCTIQFSATGQRMVGNGFSSGSFFTWRNSPSAITGSIIPTALFSGNYGYGPMMFDGVDLSALGSSSIVSAANLFWLQCIRCKLGSGYVESASIGFGNYLDFVQCDSGATNYYDARYWYQGTQIQNASVYRTGGASDGTTSLSWQLTTTAYSNWQTPFECQKIADWNTLTGSIRTVTVYGIVNAAAVPNNDQVWLECEYFGSASSPLASFATDTKANNLATGTALTADSTSQWNATARANSTSYSLGNTISVPDNAGRVFFCTGAGTSASSEPAGYASAVDGGSVTDGGATFRAGCRFSMVVTLTAQLVGYIYGTVKAAEASTTFFVDPTLNFS